MLINLTNHPSQKWGVEQTTAAVKQYGPIHDYPFPPVDAFWDAPQVKAEALRIVEELVTLHPAAVLCQGEFTMTYQIVSLLKQRDIPAIAACSERRVVTKTDADGNTIKDSVFTFRCFRDY